MLQASINNMHLIGSNLDSKEVIVDSVRRLLQAFSQLVFIETNAENITVNSNETLVTSETHFRVDLRQPIPYRHIKIFLIAIENVAQALDLQMISRKYRLAFTRNYRSLMPADKRLYRVDVLEAGQESHTLLWVNGEKYYLSDQVLRDNKRFRLCWFKLLELMRKIQFELCDNSNQKTECRNCSLKKMLLQSTSVPDSTCQYCEIDWKARLGAQLICFDVCWTRFERSYINELIDIERKSRSPIMKCIYIEEELRQYELLYNNIREKLYSRTGLTGPQTLNLSTAINESKEFSNETSSFLNMDNFQMLCPCCSEIPSNNNCYNRKEEEEKELHKVSLKIDSLYKNLTTAIAQLNGIANIKRKGRTDFDYALFRNAVLLLTEYNLKKTKDTSLIQDQPVNTHFNPSKYYWIYCTNPSRDWLHSMALNEMKSLFPLAQPLIEEMESLRNYLCALSLNPERIDPHLAQNVHLVNTLASFEAHWDESRLYLEKHFTAQSLTQFISFLSEIVDLDSNMFQVKQHDADMIEKLIDKFDHNKALSQDTDTSNEFEECNQTFEESIDSCDVGIFLAFPRLVILFYASNPFPDSYQSCLLRNLLPDTFNALTTNNNQSPMFSNDLLSMAQTIQSNLFINHDYRCKTMVPGQNDIVMEDSVRCHIFELHRFVVSHPLWPKIIPDLFQNIIYSGNNLCQFCEKTKESYNISDHSLEFSIVLNLLERCLKSYSIRSHKPWLGKTRLPMIEGLHKEVDTFLKSLEESSILLQRTKPREWNDFLKVIIKCLQAYRESSKYLTHFKSSNLFLISVNSDNKFDTTHIEPNNSKLEWLLEGSPITRFSTNPKSLWQISSNETFN